MTRLVQAAMIASLLLPLAGCSNFDPTDIFDNEIFNKKKPLPGERRAVFPEGTPGVPRGVPPELTRGYQPPATAEADPTTQAVTLEEPKPKPKAKPKPKPKVVAMPQSQPTTVTVAPQRGEQAAAGGGPAQVAPNQVQWPDPPPMR